MLDFLNGKTGSSESPPASPPVDDSLAAFGSEHTGTSTGFRAKPERARNRRTVGVIVAVAALIVLGVAGYFLRHWRPFHVEAASASLTIESVPAGAEVLVEGVPQGKTPLTMAVTPGEHALELMYEGRRKPLRAVARAGAAVVHHVEFDTAPAPEPVARKEASLRIATQPAGLRVAIDGVSRGTSPITVQHVEAGKHKVQVIGANGTIERTVEVAAGESAALIITAPAAPAGPAAGWLTVTSPLALQIIEGKDIIGTSASSRIMLPAGSHNLLLANEALGFSERRAVKVAAGSSAYIKVDPPNAPLSINALPWAEVWVDGKRLGETPIGNLPVRLGPHDIVFWHPEFGERRQTVTVTLKAPARVSVDMRKPGS